MFVYRNKSIDSDDYNTPVAFVTKLAARRKLKITDSDDSINNNENEEEYHISNNLCNSDSDEENLARKDYFIQYYTKLCIF